MMRCACGSDLMRLDRLARLSARVREVDAYLILCVNCLALHRRVTTDTDADVGVMEDAGPGPGGLSAVPGPAS